LRKHLKTYANAYDVNYTMLEKAYIDTLGAELYHSLKGCGKFLS